MSTLKLFIAAAAFQLLQAQESNGPNYVNIEVVGLPEGFLHPEMPAGVNDIILWGFEPGLTASVTQSIYENPCHYKPGGFNSGLVTASDGHPIWFLVTVNNTDPIYYYSGASTDCQSGMVGVINPPCTGNGIDSPGSYNLYRSLATQVTAEGPFPTEVTGGLLVDVQPSGKPPGPPGPYYTGFSASCTGAANSSSGSNSSSSTTSSSTAAAASSTSPGIQLSSNSSPSSPSTQSTLPSPTTTGAAPSTTTSLEPPPTSPPTNTISSNFTFTATSTPTPVLISGAGSWLFRNQHLPILSLVGFALAMISTFVIL